jgi:hypothetical protein
MNDHIFIYWDDLPLDKPTGNEQDPNLLHRQDSGIEAKDVVMDFQPDNYNLGTALTYLMRAGKKPNNPITQDIRKAIAHLEFELERQIHLQSQDEQRATSTTNEGINVNYAVLY